MHVPDLITLFVRPLNQLNITYMVTGSVASSIYGHARMTDDIDLVITLSSRDAVALHQAFDPAAFYVPPLEVIQDERARPVNGHFNIIHMESTFKADVYLTGDDAWNCEALDRRRQVHNATGEIVWVAPPEYVIVRKLCYLRDSGSTKHIADIRAMLSVQGDSLDQPWLQAAIQQLGVAKEWALVVSD